MFDNQCHETVHLKCQAISLLLANDPKLLRMLFSPDENHLVALPVDILMSSLSLSSSEKILIKIALDIWSHDGRVVLGDILHTLDAVRFEGFMLALECLRYSQSYNK